jgi:hypothetical protein
MDSEAESTDAQTHTHTLSRTDTHHTHKTVKTEKVKTEKTKWREDMSIDKHQASSSSFFLALVRRV